jgi:hypothetical protein
MSKVTAAAVVAMVAVQANPCQLVRAIVIVVVVATRRREENNLKKI